MTTTTQAIEYALQLTLEENYDKHQLMPRLREEFAKEISNLKEFCEEADLPEKFVLDLLAQMALRKRADVPTLVGLLKHHFDGQHQITANALLKSAELDLVNWDDLAQVFILVADVDPVVHADLESFQYPMPMVCAPYFLENNLSSAYIHPHGSLILKDNHHNGDICLDHLNRMNSVPLTVNVETARMVKNTWKGLDHQKPDEDYTVFQRRKKSFAKFERSAFRVIDILEDAGNRFFLTHKVDKRGRTYCQGHHINTQGNDWCKAIVEFADKEPLRE